MNLSSQVAAFWQHLKHTGLVLVFITLLALIALLAVVGVADAYAHRGAVPTGGLMAPGDPPIITHHTVAFGRTATNGTIHSGEMATPDTTNGSIHVGD